MGNDNNSGSKKMWGGRFSEGTAASVEAFSASIHYDVRLYKYDIAGSKAHAAMLSANGILTADELQAITDGLSAIEKEIDAGQFEFKRELEDVHMNIEKALIDRIGPADANVALFRRLMNMRKWPGAISRYLSFFTVTGTFRPPMSGSTLSCPMVGLTREAGRSLLGAFLLVKVNLWWW